MMNKFDLFTKFAIYPMDRGICGSDVCLDILRSVRVI